MIGHTVGALLSRTYNRYLAASVISLGIDTGLFLLLLELGMGAMAASACGYMVGILAHWLISTRFVFDGGMMSDGIERVRQKSLFVATALLGLAITVAIVGFADRAGLDPRLAKLVAIVVSFQTTYVARRLTIFRP